MTFSPDGGDSAAFSLWASRGRAVHSGETIRTILVSLRKPVI